MIIGSVASENQLNKNFKGKEIVFHFAAVADLNESNKYPLLTIKNNIIGTIKVLACKKIKLKK